MAFTERNVPPPSPAGPKIPEGVRASLLGWFQQKTGASPTYLWQLLCQREGYGTFQEVESDIGDRFGNAEAAEFIAAMRRHWDRDRQRIVAVSGVDYDAEPALKAIPAPLFLDVLEYAVAAHPHSTINTADEINRLFAKRGIYYRFTYAGKAEWHGDQGGYSNVLRPTLDLLADSRLAGARSEFEAAMHHLRAGTLKDSEDAVEEAAKSVESAMKVLLQARGITLGSAEAAKALFDKLVLHGVVVREVDNSVLAAARIRNAYGGHGSGAQARSLPHGVSSLAVHAAASAISYLAGLLP